MVRYGTPYRTKEEQSDTLRCPSSKHNLPTFTGLDLAQSQLSNFLLEFRVLVHSVNHPPTFQEHNYWVREQKLYFVSLELDQELFTSQQAAINSNGP